MSPEIMSAILVLISALASYFFGKQQAPKLPEGVTPTMLAQLGKVTAAKQEREAIASLHECVKCLHGEAKP